MFHNLIKQNIFLTILMNLGVRTRIRTRISLSLVTKLFILRERTLHCA